MTQRPSMRVRIDPRTPIIPTMERATLSVPPALASTDNRQDEASALPEVRLGDRRDGRVRVLEIRYPGDQRWNAVSRSRLAREFEADHAVWQKLSELGVKRPAPSNRSRRKREHHLYTLRLRPSDAARLDALAAKRGLCRSALVMMLVGEAEVVLKGTIS